MAKLTRTKTSDFYEVYRPMLIHLCKDGTITYRRQGQPVFNGVALPVYSVDTEAQAKAVQVRFGRRQYGEHDLLPGQPWYRWTDFSGDVDALDDVSRAIHVFYHAHLAQDWWTVVVERGAQLPVLRYGPESGHRAFDRAHSQCALHGCTFTQDDAARVLTVHASDFYAKQQRDDSDGFYTSQKTRG